MLQKLIWIVHLLERHAVTVQAFAAIGTLLLTAILAGATLW